MECTFQDNSLTAQQSRGKADPQFFCPTAWRLDRQTFVDLVCHWQPRARSSHDDVSGSLALNHGRSEPTQEGLVGVCPRSARHTAPARSFTNFLGSSVAGKVQVAQDPSRKRWRPVHRPHDLQHQSRPISVCTKSLNARRVFQRLESCSPRHIHVSEGAWYSFRTVEGRGWNRQPLSKWALHHEGTRKSCPASILQCCLHAMVVSAYVILPVGPRAHQLTGFGTIPFPRGLRQRRAPMAAIPLS